MANMLIKGIAPELMDRLRHEAKSSLRSIKQQVLVILEQAARPIPPVKLPRTIKPAKPVTAEMILQGIHEGPDDGPSYPPSPEARDE